MLNPRVIPCLLIKNGGLVKTVKFGSPKYIGDPINTVRIFNEKEVDELVIFDIDSTVQGREPNYTLIRQLAAECRMPLCYGGGVRSIGAFEQLVSIGVEKVAVGTEAIETPSLITEAAKVVGRQSVVVVLDVKKTGDDYALTIRNGTTLVRQNPVETAVRMQSLGAGEIVLNSVDRDGTMTGYDLNLIAKVREAINLPLTVIGGAGSLDDIAELIRQFGILGAGAGSLFVFKGPYRAVLINYPNRAEKQAMFDRALNVKGTA